MTATIRPVASKVGPVHFSEKLPEPVDLTKTYGKILSKRWKLARKGTTLESWLVMGFTIKPQETKVRATESVTVTDEVRDNLSEFWDYLKEHPNFVGHVKFDKVDEVAPFAAQARAWAASMTVSNADGDNGPIVFRQLPNKGLPDTEMRFSLSAQPTKAEIKVRDEARAKRAAKKAAEAAETPAGS